MKAVDPDTLQEVMLSKVPKKVHEANLKAWDLGIKYANEALAK